MIITCCKNCENRKPLCHSYCAIYTEQKLEMEKYKKERHFENTITFYHEMAVEKDIKRKPNKRNINI